MVRIDIDYESGLRCQAVHGPSGMALTTDAPVDNQGRGEAFSPTDLAATALGTCVATIMGIYAEREGFSLRGMKIVVEKTMSADQPRRITRVEMAFTMPPGLSEKHRRALENCVETCPVRRSLHPAIEVPVRFNYPG
jgi:putative redox protein